MNWLLHQLQKILGALSGRRSNSRPSTPDQSASNATDTQKSGPAIADTSSSTSANISFSIPPANLPAQQSTVSPKDAIQKANDTTDTHLRLDAASFTVPGSQSELSDVEVSQNDSLPLNESIADIQSASQLPSIHDLLPAVEQEIKANSAYFEEEASAALDSAAFDSVPLVLENNDPDEIAEPEQALLFSFDIIESTSEEENSVVEDIAEVENNTEGNAAESVQLAFSPSEPTHEETLLESAIAQPSQTNINLAPDVQPQPLSALESAEEIPPDNSPKSVADNSDAAALDKADLPYPWSIATPRKTAISEDKPLFQSEGEKQTNPKTEEDGATPEPETVPSASNLVSTEPVSTNLVSPEPVSTQPSSEKNYPAKNGVVKLLFTMKEGNFHGYIEPEDGTSDILFHQKYVNEDIFNSLERGTEVVVSVEYKEGKAYATQIELA